MESANEILTAALVWFDGASAHDDGIAGTLHLENIAKPTGGMWWLENQFATRDAFGQSECRKIAASDRVPIAAPILSVAALMERPALR